MKWILLNMDLKSNVYALFTTFYGEVIADEGDILMFVNGQLLLRKAEEIPVNLPN